MSQDRLYRAHFVVDNYSINDRFATESERNKKVYQPTRGGMRVKCACGVSLTVVFIAVLFFMSPTMNASAATTLTGTIVKIDAATGTVVVKDQYGKLWEILVPPDSGVNLSQYHVGDKVQATLEYYTPPGSKVTRARITKSQLIKLQ